MGMGVGIVWEYGNRTGFLGVQAVSRITPWWPRHDSNPRYRPLPGPMASGTALTSVGRPTWVGRGCSHKMNVPTSASKSDNLVDGGSSDGSRTEYAPKVSRESTFIGRDLGAKPPTAPDTVCDDSPRRSERGLGARRGALAFPHFSPPLSHPASHPGQASRQSGERDNGR
jgi:hypothetical protein